MEGSEAERVRMKFSNKCKRRIHELKKQHPHQPLDQLAKWLKSEFQLPRMPDKSALSKILQKDPSKFVFTDGEMKE